MMNKDLKDILCALNAHHVEYLVVGAYAVGAPSRVPPKIWISW